MKGEVLKRLFRAVASDDSQAIQSMLSVVVEEERKLGHTSLAGQLDSIIRQGTRHSDSKQLALSASSKNLSALSNGSAVKPTVLQPLSPLSSDRRFNHPFIVTIPRDQLRHHMVLSDIIENRFRRIEQEYSARDRLAHYGFKYRQKILLYGAPGCGKTMGADTF
jgi:SpoVK/Ycf46/Vps4 family AAA+-type ATPase